LSTGILLGLNQIDASVCYDCVQQQQTERLNSLQKKQAWEKVQPVSQEYPKRMEPRHEHEDLPYLQPGDKAVMALIHPVVTVSRRTSLLVRNFDRKAFHWFRTAIRLCARFCHAQVCSIVSWSLKGQQKMRASDIS